MPLPPPLRTTQQSWKTPMDLMLCCFGCLPRQGVCKGVLWGHSTLLQCRCFFSRYGYQHASQCTNCYPYLSTGTQLVLLSERALFILDVLCLQVSEGIDFSDKAGRGVVITGGHC